MSYKKEVIQAEEDKDSIFNTQIVPKAASFSLATSPTPAKSQLSMEKGIVNLAEKIRENDS